MRRSASAEGADEFRWSAAAARGMHRGHRSMVKIDGLPTCDPHSYIAMKEMRRMRLAVLMVHSIPILVISCLIVLCFLSASKKQLHREVVVMIETSGCSKWYQNNRPIGKKVARFRTRQNVVPWKLPLEPVGSTLESYLPYR